MFHFYNDLAMPLYNTMLEQGWVTGHEWDVREEPLDYPDAAAVGIIGPSSGCACLLDCSLCFAGLVTV